ncbi:DUF4145 domain-containing protein [Pseudoxanthomonas winnipegensis]|uniref:DUF4145 domain-containing protein n=1 Tax=Pseudoxanthomonas winnipegensis TaxID=2480810 RepID=A0A4V2HF76_9GAMM|nr:DUF4145 domain-containing protein [Pseudoxanthomonas winnipegensis]RZZ90776.1 DUF4145 domain-containing protein [Pseudoxanthomonas winnipegensis]TAA36115.1 DUF4145 domain-containing protein [Pseudoxanthomonas winnipegensis]
MLIDCHNCKAKVDAELLGEHNDNEFFATKTFFLKCPSCDAAIIAESQEDFVDSKTIWSRPVRVYPRPKRALGSDIPPIVRNSIDEAEKCMQSAAYLAATAMCGRSPEAICRYYKTKGSYLGGGLKELRDKGVIDSRLYQWSEELRDQRNNAAHATDTEIGAQDANDVMTFTYAIIDYVFLLAQKFDQFQKRKNDRAAEKKIGTQTAKT